MAALIILGVLLAILIGICLVPIGVDLGYEQEKLHVSAKAAGILIQLFPKPKQDEKKPAKRKKKKKKEPAPEETAPQEQKPKKKLSLPFNKDEILELVTSVIRGIGRFNRSWKVERFVLRYVAAGQDPYNTALTFGYVNAALDALAPLCRRRFKVKDLDVWTAVDFTRDEMMLDLALCMTIRIGQIFGVGLSVGFEALKILLRSRRRVKKEAKAAGIRGNDPVPPAEEKENTEEKETENRQAEERMEGNG